MEHLYKEFENQSRSLCEKTKAQGVRFRSCHNPKRKNDTGMLAYFEFCGYKINLFYIGKGIRKIYDCTLYISISFDGYENIPFSVYDILAQVLSEDFSCYTFTHLYTVTQLDAAFSVIDGLFSRLVPKLDALVDDTVSFNKLVLSQSQEIDRFFSLGDGLSREMPKNEAASKIMNLILSRYVDDTVEEALCGTQAMFFEGQCQKAAERLKKRKPPTLYERNLLKYLEQGGKPTALPEALSDKKNSIGFGAVKSAAVIICIYILTFAATAAVSELLTQVVFKDALLIVGRAEALVMLSVFDVVPSLVLGSFLVNYIKNKRRVKLGEPQKKTDKLLFKIFTALSETLLLLGCACCVFSHTAFCENSIKYNDIVFPLTSFEIPLETVECVYATDKCPYGFEGDGEMRLVVKHTAGFETDLVESTYLSFKNGEYVYAHKLENLLAKQANKFKM